MEFNLKQFLTENKLTAGSKLKSLVNEAEEDNAVIYNKLKNSILNHEITNHDKLKTDSEYQKLTPSEQRSLHNVLIHTSEMEREGVESEEDTIQDEPTAKDIKSTKGTKDLAKKQDQLAVLLRHKDELVDKYKSGELSIEDYKQKIGNIPQHIKTLTADIERLEAQAAGEGLNEEDTMLIGNPSFGGKTLKVKAGDKAIFDGEEVTITKIDRVKPGSGATKNRVIAQTADGETVTGIPALFKPIA